MFTKAIYDSLMKEKRGKALRKLQHQKEKCTDKEERQRIQKEINRLRMIMMEKGD